MSITVEQRKTLMYNSKSNRDLLALASLLALAEKVVNEKGCALLAVNGPFAHLQAVVDWCSIDGSKFEKDYARARADVGKSVPLGFVHMNPKLKYCYAVSAGYRAVAAGWYPKGVPEQVERFVRGMYEAGEGAEFSAGESFISSLIQFVPNMQKLGYFLPIVR
jgi:hypothetical protein